MASALSNRQNCTHARKTLHTQRGRTHGAGCVRQWFRTAEPLGQRRYENWNTHTHTRSLDLFTTYMKENAFSVLGKPRKQHTNSYNSYTQNGKKKRFNKECFENRKAFNKARNIFIRNKSNVNKLEYLDKNRMFNKTKRNYIGSLSALEENV